MSKKQNTKKEKIISKTMRKGYAGKLHSGSKSGPIVTNPQQMKAIAECESRSNKGCR